MDYISNIKENEEKAVSHIYHKFFPKVLAFVRRNKGNEEDAKDVFQDALFYVCYKIKVEHLKVANFEAYFFTICKNIWKRQLVKSKNKIRSKEGIPSLELEDLSINSKLGERSYEIYVNAFQKLSENCSEILSLYFNKVSYEEIRIEYAYQSANTVRQRVFKCKQKLIELIKEDKRYNEA